MLILIPDIDEVQDLIDLAIKYPILPNVKYNINMKAIHNIKQPLIKLNNMIGMKSLKKILLIKFYILYKNFILILLLIIMILCILVFMDLQEQVKLKLQNY